MLMDDTLELHAADGSGYWRDWSAPSRRLAPLMRHLAAPVLTPVLGYSPGKALRMVGDLPGPAVRQWTRWPSAMWARFAPQQRSSCGR